MSKQRRRCAVCGDTCITNVRLVWKRDSDDKLFNVCCACAEAGKVNSVSVDNYTTEDTVGHISPRTQSIIRNRALTSVRGTARLANGHRVQVLLPRWR